MTNRTNINARPAGTGVRPSVGASARAKPLALNAPPRAAARTRVLPMLDVADFVQRQFDPSNGEYDHRQLYRILQIGIREGLLPAGLKLPPSRELATALGIARNTVVHVYEQLALEGSVNAGVGRGTFVAETAGRGIDAAARRGATPTRRSLLSRRGSQLVDEAGAGRQQWGAFTPGVPEVRQFPAPVWSRLQARLWRKATPTLLSYATGAGDAGLRSAIAQHLRGARDVDCAPEQVVLTSGTQHRCGCWRSCCATPAMRSGSKSPATGAHAASCARPA